LGYNALKFSDEDSMVYNFDEIIDRKKSDSIKWNYFEDDVLPMWVADMDFISPEPVVRALEERIRHGVFGYSGESSSLTEAIAGWLELRFQWKVQPKDILSLPGVVVGFNLVSQALAGEGSAVAMQTPAYYPFLTVSKYMQGTHQETQLIQEAKGRFKLDYDAFENTMDEKTKMFLLCSPHNPSGRVWERGELERMAEICLRRGISICSDEIHADLVYQPSSHIPIATLDAEIAARTVTLMAPSKTFNIPGLGFSFAVVENQELRQKVLAAHRGLVGHPNLVGQVAAEAAYREGAEWLDQVLDYLQANRDFLVNFIRSELPCLKIYPPEGTYLAWIDCRESGIEGVPADFFREKGRVGLSDGAHFGKGGEGFVRMNFACPHSLLVEGLQRMKKALEVR
jgi:cysteine-S-conjugate beta-lyase